MWELVTGLIFQELKQGLGGCKMEVEFEKLNIPNYIKCKQGLFPIEDLSKEEIERYIELFAFSVRHRWEERKE